MKKFIFFCCIVAMLCGLCACNQDAGTYVDAVNTKITANELQEKQPTPTDINFSLERYNLIRRAYWVNGQREKANSVVCEVSKPLGYVVLFSGNTVTGSFVVDGKISSLNSYLTPDSDNYSSEYTNHWIADVDGSYGQNDGGIFFFTPDGKYIEWNGTYIYSDIPFDIDSPILRVEEGGK